MAPQRIQIHRRNRKPIIVHLPIREYAPEQRKRERALAAARPSNHTDAFARFDLECEVVEDFGAVLYHTPRVSTRFSLLMERREEGGGGGGEGGGGGTYR